MRRLRLNPLKPRELDRTVIVIFVTVAVIAVAWALRSPWPVVLGLILAQQALCVELARRYYRDIGREAARQRADRAG